ncbi:hypothetical protein [Hyunsoonleella pacifica]|uniref:DUF4282 domain-containing protein n=1 Tax=Hyunsoonleella pacifica TaxID=1080224 RepID=A0A4Q9FKQ7_9FLAO|nr:hypothetical protein [Hyunsoonleella pacifica]TBN14290.1 hypothetical protein EYD46_11990 [Hyunsoonleella pacifica]GGD12559.1 hypothetical protein GCM10011368_13140 [Hyunsoonleella pacifica]
MKFYSSKIKNLEITGRLFWIGNILFSLTLFCFSLYFLYLIYLRFGNFNRDMDINMIVTLSVVIFILLVAVFLAIEVSTLYKRIINQDVRNYVDSIDDIKGHQNEDFDF